jgi:hypothetical protein
MGTILDKFRFPLRRVGVDNGLKYIPAFNRHSDWIGWRTEWYFGHYFQTAMHPAVSIRDYACAKRCGLPKLHHW